MSSAVIATDLAALGFNARFLFCGALACLFLVSTVILVVVMLRRAGPG